MCGTFLAGGCLTLQMSRGAAPGPQRRVSDAQGDLLGSGNGSNSGHRGQPRRGCNRPGRGDPGALEQNYEYDLLNPQKLLDKFVGKQLKLMVGEGTLIDALLLSNNNGPIYRINGQIHPGHYGRVILPDTPENLIPKPTLVWLLHNRAGRPQRVEASYLTAGITWKADYVVVLNAKDSGGDLSGWVTVDNKSGATYTDAALKLVAGDIHRAVTRREMRDALEYAGKAAMAEAPRPFQQESFFEYHLYSLQGRTTIKQNQTKQISLLDAADIPIKKELRFYGASQYYRSQLGTPLSNQKVSVFLEIANKEQYHLGMPLPRGVVRVYKAASDKSLQFIGEDVIDHTPKDEKVKIKMGEAFDVAGERTQRDWRKIAPGLYETEWDVQIRNHKKEDVQVTIIEPVPGDWEVIKSSHPYDKIEAHTLQYVVKVPQDGKTTVTYRVRMRWQVFHLQTRQARARRPGPFRPPATASRDSPGWGDPATIIDTE